MEIVQEGWLLKLIPPSKLWKKRWTKKWVVVRQSGEIPGQYLICYYSDKAKQKLKGTINLDNCDQLDSGLKITDKTVVVENIFNVQTTDKTHYFAANTDDEMMKWVQCICYICDLRHFDILEFGPEHANILKETIQKNQLPPVSPTINDFYIPISECYSDRNNFLADLPCSSNEMLHQVSVIKIKRYRKFVKQFRSVCVPNNTSSMVNNFNRCNNIYNSTSLNSKRKMTEVTLPDTFLTPPPIDRKLKPKIPRILISDVDDNYINLNGTSSSSNYDQEMSIKLEYLDLDFDHIDPDKSLENKIISSHPVTIYTSVDFVRTDGIRKTKEKMEKERQSRFDTL